MRTKRFIIDAMGIFVSYFVFAILQEKVTKGQYLYDAVDANGEKTVITEKYTYVLTLVFVMCLTNGIVSIIASQIWPQGEDTTPKLYYMSVAITYLLAMVSSTMALQWISYPTQVIGKAGKPIPIMILGVLIGKKSYSYKKYLFVLLIVIGVVLFVLKDINSKNSPDINLGLGELLLILSLTMDGLTGGIQERIRAESRPSGLQMMKASNVWSTLYLGAGLIVTGEGMEFVQFAGRHPSIIGSLIVVGLTQSVGQIFLYSMVSLFGPLAVSVVTTTRKFFTVIASVIIFGNSLSSRQWLGAIMVFLGLFLDAFYGKSPQKNFVK